MKKIAMMIAVCVLSLAFQSKLGFAKKEERSSEKVAKVKRTSKVKKTDLGERETCPECEKASSRGEKDMVSVGGSTKKDNAKTGTGDKSSGVEARSSKK